MASTQLNEVGGVAVRDQIKQPLYDSIDITAASNVKEERSFFSNTAGKTLTQTNIKVGGQLERNKSFRIMGIQVDALSQDSTKRQLLALYSVYSYVELWLSEKQYWQSPLRTVTGKIRYHSALAGETDAADVYQQLGDAGCNPLSLQGNLTLDIGPLTNFYMKWVVEGVSDDQVTAMTPSAGNPVRFVAYLKGLLRRPVQ